MTRDEAIEWLKKDNLNNIMSVFDKKTKEVHDKREEAFSMAIKALEKPERKKGRWMEYKKPYDVDGEYYCYCSECYSDAHEHHLYCPNCGAKMEATE